MRKFIAFIFVALLLMVTVQPAHALYGLEKFWGAVYDENGNIRTDVDTVTVWTEDTTTVATVYSDNVGTSLTNPITTGLSDGIFEFYSATSEFDVLIEAGSRATLLEDWSTSSKHDIVIDTQVATDRVMRFLPNEFIGYDWDSGDNLGKQSAIVLLTSTAPALGVRNDASCLIWLDATETYAQVTFKVPDDYISEGTFRAFTDYNTGSDHPNIQYRVFINSDGTVWDVSYTTQTKVDPAGTAGTPELTALPITTDFASLAAGEIVTFAVTRDNIDTSAAELELYYVEFSYSAKN